ncbi:Mu-like prophage major head subunit gpT family protein [Acinetobacter modestus]|uniref:Mu-like prophage major head subunit gpT family protein n=1 Tax=Acinetobacter modestus TaxID=1776740 RepID=UPI003019E57D
MIIKQVTAAVLQAVYSNLRADFNNAFKETEVQYLKVATVVPSSSSENDYGWVSEFPSMTEWVGKKTIQELEEHGYAVKNKAFQVTIAVKKHRIDDNQLGAYKIQAQGAGKSAKKLPNQQVFKLLNNAFVTKCFDGQPMISSNHKIGKKNVSNKGVKPLSIASLEAAQESFGAARIAMRSLLNENGDPLDLNPTLLVVPPALGDIARALVTATQFKDGNPNPYKGAAEVLEVGALTDPDAWFLMDVDQAIKPLIWQNREEAHLVSQTDLSSERVFMDGEFLFGAEARGNAGFTFWQLIYGSTGKG